MLELWQKWFANRPSLAVGPIYTDPLVEEYWTKQAIAAESSEVLKVLDAALKKSGENSLIYVSTIFIDANGSQESSPADVVRHDILGFRARKSMGRSR